VEEGFIMILMNKLGRGKKWREYKKVNDRRNDG